MTTKVEWTSQDTINSILNARVLRVVRTDLRREPRKVIAAEVRSLLKSLGIRGVSVISPNYSMAHSIDLKVPRPSHPGRDETVASDWNDHDFATCPICRQRQAAIRHLEDMILAAFPDLNDRSEYGTDYYDYKLSIN